MKKFIRELLNILLFPFKIIMLFSLINLEVEIFNFKKLVKNFNCKKLEEIIEEVMFKWKNFYEEY